MRKPFDLKADYQPKEFDFKDKAKVEEIIARYPKGFQKSAVMPLLDLAQRQVGEEGLSANPVYGGWIPRAAMDKIGEMLSMPPVKVYEVATFYSMYNLAPVGKYLVQICGTTPCWLCGAEELIKACTSFLEIEMGQTTEDGMFTLMEVECLGACVNAPMVQINDNYYEDLNSDSMTEILKCLKEGKEVSVGSQTGRQTSMSKAGPTTLEKEAKKAKVI
jgi:NADH-quinone oxidoreductase subunit E